MSLAQSGHTAHTTPSSDHPRPQHSHHAGAKAAANTVCVYGRGSAAASTAGRGRRRRRLRRRLCLLDRQRVDVRHLGLQGVIHLCRGRSGGAVEYGIRPMHGARNGNERLVRSAGTAACSAAKCDWGWASLGPGTFPRPKSGSCGGKLVVHVCSVVIKLPGRTHASATLTQQYVSALPSCC